MYRSEESEVSKGNTDRIAAFKIDWCKFLPDLGIITIQRKLQINVFQYVSRIYRWCTELTQLR